MDQSWLLSCPVVHKERKMRCPLCNAPAAVKATRAQPDNTVRRRYECFNLHRFNTMEQHAVFPGRWIKRLDSERTTDAL